MVRVVRAEKTGFLVKIFWVKYYMKNRKIFALFALHLLLFIYIVY